jgi:proteasome lid subunit RPN8/RPN11
LKKQDLIKK